MANRALFTLATIMMVLFFLASQYDNFFFPMHFLEAVIYAVLLLLLYYGLEDWAYVMGFLTPLLWIILTLLSGTLLGGLEALGQITTLQVVQNPKAVVAGLVFVTSVALIVVSWRAFYREVWGKPGALGTTVGAAVVVVAYYAMLGVVLYRMVTPVG
jgi:hypothetical protein